MRYRPRVPDAPIANLSLVGGGARSGKSRFALELARTMGRRRLFIATGQALDQEMAIRIDRHRVERGADFSTIEEPLNLAGALDANGPAADVVLVDCLTLWVSNLLMRHQAHRRDNPDRRAAGGTAPDDAAAADADDDAADPDAGVLAAAFDSLEGALVRCAAPVILVTNEVGLGLVPDTPLGRAFRDAIGGLHQRLAARADRIYAAVMGVVLRLHPAPVEVVSRPSLPAPARAGRP